MADAPSLPSLTLFGDETGIPITVEEATFTCHLLPTIRIARVDVRLVVVNTVTMGAVKASLKFPLPDGATVRGYQFQVGAHMLDACCVTKQKAAAVAYKEQEKGRAVSTTQAVQGNMWQTDVFPLPKGESRELIVSYVCSMTTGGKDILLQIPMSFGAPVKVVRVVKHVHEVTATTVTDTLGGVAMNTQLSTGIQVRVEIPKPEEVGVVSAVLYGKRHFCAFLPTVEEKVNTTTQKSAEEEGPALVHIIWDISGSCAGLWNSRVEKILGDIEGEFKRLGRNIAFRVTLLTTHTERALERGTAAEVTQFLKGIQANGGSNLGLLGGVVHDPEADHYLFVSDGIDNMTKRDIDVSGANAPVHTLVPEANQVGPAGVASGTLRRLSYQTGGECVTLSSGTKLVGILAGTLGGGGCITRVSCPAMEGDESEELLGSGDLSTVPDCRLLAQRWSIPSEGGYVTGTIPEGASVTEFVVTVRGSGGEVKEVRVPLGGDPSGSVEVGSVVGTQVALAAIDHAKVSVPDVQMTEVFQREKALAYGLAGPHTSLLLLHAAEQFVENELTPPPTHPEYSRWQQLKAVYDAEAEVRKKKEEDQMQEKLTSVRQLAAGYQTLTKKVPGWGAREVKGKGKKRKGRAMAGRAMAEGSDDDDGDDEPPPGACAPQSRSRRSAAEDCCAFEDEACREGSMDEECEAIAECAAAMPEDDESEEGESDSPLAGSAPQLKKKKKEESKQEPEEPPAVHTQRVATLSQEEALTAIRSCLPDVDLTYQTFLTHLRDSPTYFMSSAEILRDGGAPPSVCVRVVMNVLETCLPSAQTCRAVAYFLTSIDFLDDALLLFETVLELAPEEPQSHTDLALAGLLWLRSRTADGPTTTTRLQIVIDHLTTVVLRHWASRFDEIEWPVLLLLSWAVDWGEYKGLGNLWPEAKLPGVDFRLKHPERGRLTADVFVWLGWDTDFTDVDLHVDEPLGETVYYGHRRSSTTGAAGSKDFTQGYGPECYVCVDAPPGTYNVKVKYYASHQASTTTGGTSAIIWRVTDMGDFEKERLAFSTRRLNAHKQWEDVLAIQRGGGVKKLGPWLVSKCVGERERCHFPKDLGVEEKGGRQGGRDSVPATSQEERDVLRGTT